MNGPLQSLFPSAIPDCFCRSPVNSIPIIRPPVAANCVIYNISQKKKQLAKLFRFAGEPRLKFMEKQRPCGCLNEHFSFLAPKLAIKDPETLTERFTKYKSDRSVSYSSKSLTTRWQVLKVCCFVKLWHDCCQQASLRLDSLPSCWKN